MAYADFTLSRLVDEFGLSLEEKTAVYDSVPPVVVRPAFEADLAETAPLALMVSTEKVRSELIIAPILTEVWRIAKHRIGFHSGVDFNVEPALGLAGTCDFIITRSPEQLFVKAPVILIAEAKNEDIKRGYAQCIAAMVAAQRFNERAGVSMPKLYGAVTVGEKWKFLEIDASDVRIDITDYYIKDVGKILGILLHMATD